MHYKKLVMSFVLGGSDGKLKDHRSIKLLQMKRVLELLFTCLIAIS